MLYFQVAVASPTLTDHITDLNDNITSIKFDQLFDPTMTTDDHATALLQLLGSTASQTIDACMSFDPHTVPFASRVHQLLGLPGGTSDSGSRTVLDRLVTQRMLTTRNDAIPQWPPSHLYSALFGHNGYAGEADQTIKDAIEQFGTSGHLKDLTRILTKSLPLYHICIVVHKRRLIGAVVGFQNCNGNDVIEVETDLPSDKTEPVDHRIVSMLQRDELDQRSLRRSDDLQRNRSKADRDRALSADDVSQSPVLPPSSIVLWGGFGSHALCWSVATFNRCCQSSTPYLICSVPGSATSNKQNEFGMLNYCWMVLTNEPVEWYCSLQGQTWMGLRDLGC